MLFLQKLSFRMGLTGSSCCCCTEAHSSLAGYHGTVNPSGGGWKLSILLGYSLVMLCIPFTGTAECARDTEMGHVRGASFIPVLWERLHPALAAKLNILHMREVSVTVTLPTAPGGLEHPSAS